MVLIFTVGIAIGAIIAAILNILANYLSFRKAEKSKKKENVNILFGELLNVLYHYQFSSIPMRIVDGDERDVSEVLKRLAFARYGEFSAVKDSNVYSFLSPLHIRNTHQLASRIRNTDTLIEKCLRSEYVNNLEMAEHEEIYLIREIDSRMDYVAETAELVLSYIIDQYPELSALIQDTKNLEEPKYEL